jgi:type IV secretory pathway component VirB8
VNRLLILCILAQREIKLFAGIAFYDNPEYYDKHYASDRRREIRIKSEQNSDETQTEEELVLQGGDE